ncbi:MAG: hypothetical protein AAGD35_12180 [Actinomycetota bacterium]
MADTAGDNVTEPAAEVVASVPATDGTLAIAMGTVALPEDE